MTALRGVCGAFGSYTFHWRHLISLFVCRLLLLGFPSFFVAGLSNGLYHLLSWPSRIWAYPACAVVAVLTRPPCVLVEVTLALWYLRPACVPLTTSIVSLKLVRVSFIPVWMQSTFHFARLLLVLEAVGLQSTIRNHSPKTKRFLYPVSAIPISVVPQLTIGLCMEMGIGAFPSSHPSPPIWSICVVITLEVTVIDEAYCFRLLRYRDLNPIHLFVSFHLICADVGWSPCDVRRCLATIVRQERPGIDGFHVYPYWKATHGGPSDRVRPTPLARVS
ncbi:hypothetical protein BKA93DRAFT_751058 [Sparassis latifolia]